MNPVMVLPDSELYDMFNGLCIWDMADRASCIHEIETRAQNPNGWMKTENRVPLCNKHHTMVHDYGASRIADELRERRQRALDVFSNSG